MKKVKSGQPSQEPASVIIGNGALLENFQPVAGFEPEEQPVEQLSSNLRRPMSDENKVSANEGLPKLSAILIRQERINKNKENIKKRLARKKKWLLRKANQQVPNQIPTQQDSSTELNSTPAPLSKSQKAKARKKEKLLTKQQAKAEKEKKQQQQAMSPVETKSPTHKNPIDLDLAIPPSSEMKEAAMLGLYDYDDEDLLVLATPEQKEKYSNKSKKPVPEQKEKRTFKRRIEYSHFLKPHSELTELVTEMHTKWQARAKELQEKHSLLIPVIDEETSAQQIRKQIQQLRQSGRYLEQFCYIISSLSKENMAETPLQNIDVKDRLGKLALFLLYSENIREDGRKILEMLYKHFPKDAGVIGMLSRFYSLMRLHQSNDELLSKAENNNNPWVLIHRAIYLKHKQEYIEAEEILLDLCDQELNQKITPCIRYRLDLSLLYMDTERYQEAELYLRELLDDYPENTKVVLTVLDCWKTMGKYEEFFTILKQVKEREFSADFFARLSLVEANCYMRRGNYQEAAAICRNLIGSNNYYVSNKAMCDLAICLSTTGRVDAALEVLSETVVQVSQQNELKSTPARESLYKMITLGRMYVDKKDFTQAEHVFQMLPADHPAVVRAHARMYEKKSDYSNAEKILKQHPDYYKNLELRRGHIRLLERSRKVSLETLLELNQQLIADSITCMGQCDKNAYIQLSRIMSKMGRHDDAHDEIDNCIKAFPYYDYVYYVKIRKFLLANNTKKALACSREAMALPQFQYNTLLHRIHIEVLLEAGLTEEAFKIKKESFAKFLGNTAFFNKINELFSDYDVAPLKNEVKQEMVEPAPIQKEQKEKTATVLHPQHTGIYLPVPDVLLAYQKFLTEDKAASQLKGGAVLDMILMKKPNDYDVSTNIPEEKLRKLPNAYFSPYVKGLCQLKTSHASIDILSDPELILDSKKDTVTRATAESALAQDLTTGEVIDASKKALKSIIKREIILTDDTIANDDKKIDALFRQNPKLLMRIASRVAKYGFTLSPFLKQAIERNAVLIKTDLTTEERFSLFKKSFMQGYSAAHFNAWVELGLFKALFPKVQNLDWLKFRFQRMDDAFQHGSTFSENHVLSLVVAAVLADNQVRLKKEWSDNLEQAVEAIIEENELDDFTRTDPDGPPDADLIYKIQRLMNGCLSYREGKPPAQMYVYHFDAQDAASQHNLATYYIKMAESWQEEKQKSIFEQQAFAHYLQAAALPGAYPLTYYAIGTCYVEGKGVEKDLIKAKEFLEKAANENCAPAWYSLAQLYNKSDDCYQEALKQAVKYRDAHAMYDLAVSYEEEGRLKQAATWYYLAAQKGIARAQFRIGTLFEKGEGGMPRDQNIALLWFIRAANGKVPEALNHPAIQNILNSTPTSLTVGSLRFFPPSPPQPESKRGVKIEGLLPEVIPKLSSF